jgi:hypothetical protein
MPKASYVILKPIAVNGAHQRSKDNHSHIETWNTMLKETGCIECWVKKGQIRRIFDAREGTYAAHDDANCLGFVDASTFAGFMLLHLDSAKSGNNNLMDYITESLMGPSLDHR